MKFTHNGDKLAMCNLFNSDILDVLDFNKTTGIFFNRLNIFNVDGAGNSTELLNYSFNDFEMSSEIMYYRLIQVDYDGSNTMADIVSVQVKNDELVIYPNPSSAIFIIHSNDIIRNINVLDNFGRLVMQNNSSSIDLSDFENGVYQLCITTDSKTIIRKIIKYE